MPHAGVLAYAVQSQFSVSAATGQSFQRLADGIPRRGSVTAFKHSYFRVWMDSAYDDLTITVTPFSGDPDLYVTTGDDRDHPNATNAYWKSTAFRSDAVTIGKGSEHSCVKCYYYIAYEQNKNKKQHQRCNSVPCSLLARWLVRSLIGPGCGVDCTIDPQLPDRASPLNRPALLTYFFLLCFARF